MMNRMVCIAMIVLLASACGQNDAGKQKKTTPINVPQLDMTTLNSPPLPNDWVQRIGLNGDHIDVIFYNLPISISRESNKDVQAMLAQVGSQPPGEVAICRAIGRIFFQSGSETIAEADLFLGESCNYYLFYENGKPAYANLLLPEGIQFYENLVRPYRR